MDQGKLIRKAVLKKINPFLVNNPILYPQKKSENKFFWCFQGL